MRGNTRQMVHGYGSKHAHHPGAFGAQVWFLQVLCQFVRCKKCEQARAREVAVASFSAVNTPWNDAQPFL